MPNRGTIQLAALLILVACAGERATPSAAIIARGSYLANGVARCFWCHSPLDNSNPAYPGPDILGSGDILDKATPIVASNLTPDLETGLGGWTDREIIVAIRQGIGRDGHQLRAHPGSYYSVMTDDDAASVVGYLRSLRAIKRKLPRSAAATSFRDSIQSSVEPADPERLHTPLERGAYLVQLGECLGCHTTTTPSGSPAVDMRYGGGRLFYVEMGVGSEVHSSNSKHNGTTDAGAPIVASANITPDASGIPYYTEQVFITTIRTGRVAGVRPLSAAMPWIFFRNMTDDDLRAVFAYLRSLPPVSHTVINAEAPTFCRLCGRWHGGGASNFAKDPNSLR
jgi:mono/diheme cytochrome c family protein